MFNDKLSTDSLIVAKKQEEKKLEKVLIDLIEPYNGHIIYEIDYINKIYSVAKYKVIDTVHIHYWREQLKNKEIVKNENCIYVSSLNKKNLRDKLLKYTEGELDINMFKYVSNKHNSGSNLKVNIINESFK